MAIKGNKDEEQRRRMDRRDFWRVKMAKEKNVVTYKKTSNIIEDARTIINSARSSAVRSVDFCRVQMYWNLGKRIFEEEQQGKERADYGTYLIKNLASTLESEYGSGFGVRQLADLVLLVEHEGKNINWNNFIEKAKKSGLYKFSLGMFKVCNYLFNMEIPKELNDGNNDEGGKGFTYASDSV